MFKKAIISSLLICLFLASKAQNTTRHLLFVNAGAGLQNLSYSLANGSHKGGAGFTVNAGYSYVLSPNWGLESGIGIESVKAKATMNHMSETLDIDTDGASYMFRTYYKNWKEKQSTCLVDIPLGVNFRKNFWHKWGGVISAGAKISIPLAAKYNVTGGTIATTGYYSKWNVELSDMPQHGFTSISERFSGKISLNPAYSLYANLSATYKLNPSMDLFAGGYFSYGINNMIKSRDNEVYQKDGTYHGVINSNQVNKAFPVTLDVKVGILWNLNTKKKQTKIEYPSVHKIRPGWFNIAKFIKEHKITLHKKNSSLSSVKKDVKLSETNQDSSSSTRPIHQLSLIDSTYAVARRLAAHTKIKFSINLARPYYVDQDTIERLSTILKSHPQMQLDIIGHTSDIEPLEENIQLGMERAQFVRDEFLRLGVSVKQLHCQSKAFREPLVPNTSEDNRALNRRVQLKIE